MTSPRTSNALFGKTRQGVLGLLFGHPDQAFYTRQIVETVGTGTSQVQRELDQLTRAGLLLREPRNRHVYFRANPDAAVFPELTGLARKLGGRESTLRSRSASDNRTALLSAAQHAAIARLAHGHGLKRISLFGSGARGQLRDVSDIDLLIEFLPNRRPTLWQLPALQEELARIFGGRRVDVATPEILENPYRRAAVLRDVVELYAA